MANGAFYGIGWYSIVVNLAEITFFCMSAIFCFWCVGAVFIMKKNRSLRANCLFANRCAPSNLASFIEPHTSGCSSGHFISLLTIKNGHSVPLATHGRIKNSHARNQTSEIRARTHSTRNSCTRWILFYSLVSNAAALGRRMSLKLFGCAFVVVVAVVCCWCSMLVYFALRQIFCHCKSIGYKINAINWTGWKQSTSSTKTPNNSIETHDAP